MRCRAGLFMALSLPLLFACPVVAAPSSSPVVRELTERRTMNSRTFLLADGAKRVQISARPIHFKAADGSWQPIDTSLSATAKAGFTRANERNVLKSYFPGGTDGWVRAECDEGAVFFRPVGAVSVPTSANATSTSWQELWSNTTLVLTPTAGGLKETITLASKDAPKTFSFSLRTEGLAARLNPDGSATLLNGAKPVLSVMRPWMRDASGKRSYSIDVALRDTPDGLEYAMTPDPVWLAAARYPVTLDPTIFYIYDPIWNGTGASAAPDDTRVMRDGPNGLTVYPDGLPLVVIGQDPDYPSDTSKRCEAIMVFGNLMSGTGIPSNATINNATLKIENSGYGGENAAGTMVLAPIAYSQYADVSWSLIESARDAPSPYLSRVSADLANYPETTADITPIVAEWADSGQRMGIVLNSAENHPLFLRAQDHDALQIEYTDSVGLVDMTLLQPAGGLPTGQEDITESFGMVAHPDTSNASGLASHFHLLNGEMDSFQSASAFMRTDLFWYSTEVTQGVDSSGDSFTTIQLFAEEALRKGIRPLLILEPVRPGKTFSAHSVLEIMESIPYSTSPTSTPATIEDTLAMGFLQSPQHLAYWNVPEPESAWETAFANWAKGVVEAVRNNKVMYELVNEPQGYLPDPVDYAHLVRKTVETIRISQNPNATLLLGGVAQPHGDTDWPYFEKVLALLSSPECLISVPGLGQIPALDAIDAISIHPYRFNNPPEQAKATLTRVRMLLHKYSPEREIPLMVTEAGFATNSDYQNTGESLPWATQARYLVRQRLYSAGERLAGNAWYGWTDDNIYDVLDPNPNLSHDPIEQASGRFVETRWGTNTQWPVVQDFESASVPAQWQAAADSGTAPTLSTAFDPTTWHSHRQVLRFLKSDAQSTRTYYVGTADTLPRNPAPNGIGMWIRGNTSGFLLKCRLVDAVGQVFEPALVPSARWASRRPANPQAYDQEWRYLQAALPDLRSYVPPMTVQRVIQMAGGTGTLDLLINNITYSYPRRTRLPKPALLAGQAMVDQLKDYRFVRYLNVANDGPSAYHMLLENDSGTEPQFALALWRRDDLTVYYGASYGPVPYIDMYGVNQWTGSNGAIPVGQDPVYYKVGPNAAPYSLLRDKASWSWVPGTGTPAANLGDRLRSTVIMGGTPLSTTFRLDNRSTHSRMYFITFQIENGTAVPTGPGQNYVVDDLQVMAVVGAGASITVPVTLTTYLRTTTTTAHVVITALAHPSYTADYTDEADVPLVVGNPLTLTAGPFVVEPTGVSTWGYATVGIEAPGAFSTGDGQLSLQFSSGPAQGQALDVSLPVVLPGDIAPPYIAVSSDIVAPPTGSSYTSTADLKDASNHVIASASSTFLTHKMYDDTPTSPTDPWPSGLHIDDAASAWYAKAVSNDLDLGINYLSLYGINFTIPKVPNNPVSSVVPTYVSGDDLHIPEGATGIGMWINPHGCSNTLMAMFQDSRTDPESFTFLQGFQDSAYNFGHTQDNALLDWTGWRWVTMPFASPLSSSAGDSSPYGWRFWMNPLYIQQRYGPSASVDICGITYLM